MNKILRYSLLAVLAIVGMGNASAGDPAKVLTFPAAGGEEISSYTVEWTATVGEDVWTLNGFNTNKNAWSYVRCGRKNNEHTATITSPVVNVAITDYVVTVDKTSNVTKATLTIGSTATDITEQFKAGDIDIKVSAEAGSTFTLTIESSSASSNGTTQISKVALYESGKYQEAHIANTQETAYTVAKAIELIDAGVALTDEVYVKGRISQLDSYSNGAITYWISDDGTTTNQFECYKGKGMNGADFAALTDLKRGATVIVKGTLTKYNTTYEFNAGNILVSNDESTAVKEESIANTEETAYTVAKAIELIDAGKSLTDVVFIKGIVSQVDKFNDSYKSINYWISDDGTTTIQFECYSGKGINGADFTSIEDVKVGATVIVKGTMKKYNDIYEFNYNNELVKYDESTASVNAMKAEANADGPAYNVAGQKVADGFKGLVIKNGKKIIMK